MCQLEAQLDLLKKEKQDYISRCAAEARRMAEEVETETRKSDLVEREAADFLKVRLYAIQTRFILICITLQMSSDGCELVGFSYLRCIILILIGLSLLSKASNAKLQEIIAQTEEEVQTCALELFAVVDTVSKYKEFVTSKIATMKNALAETVGAVADMHKAGLPGSVASR